MSDGSFRGVAAEIVAAADGGERAALLGWAEALTEIRGSGAGPIRKARRALAATCDRKTVWPFVKAIWQEKRRHGWDSRGLSSGVGVLGVLVFGGAWAGLAPLGEAANLPVWMVIGSGAEFAEALRGELRSGDVRPAMEGGPG